MATGNINVLDPAHESKQHLIISNSDGEPTLLCDSPLEYDDGTIREKEIGEINPENTCAECIHTAKERL